MAKKGDHIRYRVGDKEVTGVVMSVRNHTGKNEYYVRRESGVDNVDPQQGQQTDHITDDDIIGRVNESSVSDDPANETPEDELASEGYVEWPSGERMELGANQTSTMVSAASTDSFKGRLANFLADKGSELIQAYGDYRKDALDLVKKAQKTGEVDFDKLKELGKKMGLMTGNEPTSHEDMDEGGATTNPEEVNEDWMDDVTNTGNRIKSRGYGYLAAALLAVIGFTSAVDYGDGPAIRDVNNVEGPAYMIARPLLEFFRFLAEDMMGIFIGDPAILMIGATAVTLIVCLILAFSVVHMSGRFDTGKPSWMQAQSQGDGPMVECVANSYRRMYA